MMQRFLKSVVWIAVLFCGLAVRANAPSGHCAARLTSSEAVRHDCLPQVQHWDGVAAHGGDWCERCEKDEREKEESLENRAALAALETTSNGGQVTSWLDTESKLGHWRNLALYVLFGAWRSFLPIGFVLNFPLALV